MSLEERGSPFGCALEPGFGVLATCPQSGVCLQKPALACGTVPDFSKSLTAFERHSRKSPRTANSLAFSSEISNRSPF